LSSAVEVLLNSAANFLIELAALRALPRAALDVFTCSASNVANSS